MLSETRLPLDAGDFALMSRRVVQQRQMPEHHRYLRGLRSWVGFRQIGIAIDREERHSGRSKYGLLKSEAGIGRNLCILYRSAPGCDYPWWSRNWNLGTLRTLRAICEGLSGPIPGWLYRSGVPYHFSVRSSAIFPRNHWRIRGARVRRNQSAPTLRHQQNHSRRVLLPV